MSIFAAKPTPSVDKLRGGYYTPEPLARFIAEWTLSAGPRQLEPSCGDGAILRFMAVPGAFPQGVEYLENEAQKAKTFAPVDSADFFEWLTPAKHGTFDGVAGNPPYIRFGSWESESRDRALSLMRTQGLKPTKYTNSWVPFVVGSLLAVRSGGRVGLVVPAELLQVGYAAQLRGWLVDNCAHITLVSFEKLLFPGILQEVVLLLLERGSGPALIRTVEIKGASALAELDLSSHPEVRAPLHEGEKWTKYYLPPADIELVRAIRRDGKFLAIGELAAVNVGVVTGRNSFFCMDSQTAFSRGLDQLTVPLVSRSVQLQGLTFGPSDLQALDASGSTTRLLSFADSISPALHRALADYVALGESEGVHEGYKCRIRRNWWEVPSVRVPDGFMLRQISNHPKLVANLTGATSTDTVHRVYTAPGVNMKHLAAAAYNSITFALCEVTGRSYGGGILELEPSEAQELLVPNPKHMTDALASQVDSLVRERKIFEALDLVDQSLLIDRLGISPSDISDMRRIWSRMRDRRISRNKKTLVLPDIEIESELLVSV